MDSYQAMGSFRYHRPPSILRKTVPPKIITTREGTNGSDMRSPTLRSPIMEYTEPFPNVGQIETNYDEITDTFDAMNLKQDLLRGKREMVERNEHSLCNARCLRVWF